MKYELEKPRAKRAAISEAVRTVLFVRDGGIDRWTGERLTFAGLMRLRSHIDPEGFRFHKNWKFGECHPDYWTKYPTVDHVEALSLGGADSIGNWVCSCMATNAKKSNLRGEEHGLTLFEPGDPAEALADLREFIAIMEARPELKKVKFLRPWYWAAKGVLGEAVELTPAHKAHATRRADPDYDPSAPALKAWETIRVKESPA